MKKFYSTLFAMISFAAFSQVGIGTTTPNSDALLDVDATTIKGGVLMPRIELTSTTSAFPLVNHVAGMTLYNTATTTGATAVKPGYYYNNGVRWLRLVTEADVDTKAWSTEGNAGTTAGTNFIGTTDNQAMVVKTNNVNRFRLTETGSLRSYNTGTAAEPVYSWTDASGTGIWRPGTNNIGFSTNAIERFRIDFRGQLLAMGEGTPTLPSFSWNTSNSTGIYNPIAQSIGFTTAGVERLRIPNANQIHAMRWGSASAPFYAFDTDKGAGMYLVGAGILGFSTYGAEKFRMTIFGQIQSSNNGISTAPSYSWVSSPRTGILLPSANTIGFNINGSERMRVDSNGNVGIRSSAPSQPLHVNGNVRIDGALMPGNSAGTTGQLLQSAGANSSPTWGPKITQFSAGPSDISYGSRVRLYTTVAGLNPNSTAIVTIRGDNWYYPQVTIDYVAIEGNEIRWVVQNNTSATIFGTSYNNMYFNITIIN